MPEHIILLTIAFIVDLIIGDPRGFPHPVIIIGHSIAKLELFIRKYVGRWGLKLAGLLFPLLIVGGSYIITAGLLFSLQFIHNTLAALVEIWLISTTIASKGLKQAAMEIYHHLQSKELQKARDSLSMVVGRDTAKLDEREVARGAIETVAENIVDAIISPLFFALLGGAPLAMAYRAANTLDSMVGYKNEKYKDLGWASARLDDVMNFIPARITAILLLVSSVIFKFNVKGALSAIRRDAKLHPSPNSGYPEAAVAGALEIQLGGTNYYGGIPSHRAKMGEQIKEISEEHIIQTIKLMYASSVLFICFLLVFFGSVI